jgi:hypothetical protein
LESSNVADVFFFLSGDHFVPVALVADVDVVGLSELRQERILDGGLWASREEEAGATAAGVGAGAEAGSGIAVAAVGGGGDEGGDALTAVAECEEEMDVIDLRMPRLNRVKKPMTVPFFFSSCLGDV